MRRWLEALRLFGRFKSFSGHVSVQTRTIDTRVLNKRRCGVRFLLFFSTLIAVGCSSSLDFGGDAELKALTYTEYVADGGAVWFDPIGASDIYHRCISSRDGYDAWWRFTISESNSHELVISVARQNEGPTDVKWDDTTAYPRTWRPDDSPPRWWPRNVGSSAKSIHWCYDAGTAERHHGWYFAYDAESQLMSVWHWNHQWSSDQCTAAKTR